MTSKKSTLANRVKKEAEIQECGETIAGLQNIISESEERFNPNEVKLKTTIADLRDKLRKRDRQIEDLEEEIVALRAKARLPSGKSEPVTPAPGVADPASKEDVDTLTPTIKPWNLNPQTRITTTEHDRIVFEKMSKAIKDSRVATVTIQKSQQELLGYIKSQKTEIQLRREQYDALNIQKSLWNKE